MLRDVREGLLQVPPRGIRREGHLRVRVALHQQDPQLEEDQALLLLGHAGSRDHCAEGCAAATHQNTLRIQGESFVIIKVISYWEMPGSRDHCAEGCAAADHQITIPL